MLLVRLESITGLVPHYIYVSASIGMHLLAARVSAEDHHSLIP